LGRLRQENLKFKASLGYKERPWRKKSCWPKDRRAQLDWKNILMVY
jgi:hypothetical protein